MTLRSLMFGILLAAFGVGAETAAAATSVPVVKVQDSINVAVSEYLARAVEAARRQGSPAILIELDTPGGFLEATRDIVQLLLNSDLPVIVWVTPSGARAASAGSMITMAAHYAAMAPSTSIGAATPVNGGGGDIGKDMRDKIRNDTLSWVSGIAEKRGRNGEWARKSVSEAASLTASEALKLHVIDGVFAAREEVWRGARVKFPALPADVRFEEFPPLLKERVLSFLSNPNIAYGLLAIGGLGLYMEITHPGAVVPGAVGAVALAVGAITMKIIPIRPGALVLLVVGVVLLIIELLTPLPTFGVAGVGAGVCFLLSGIFLLDSAETDLRLSAALWLPAFFVLVGFMVLLGLAAGRALRSPGYKQGLTALTGLEAEVLDVDAQGAARIQVRGELWTAKWARGQGTGPFQKGQRVKVVEQRGLTAYVERISSST